MRVAWPRTWRTGAHASRGKGRWHERIRNARTTRTHVHTHTHTHTYTRARARAHTHMKVRATTAPTGALGGLPVHLDEGEAARAVAACPVGHAAEDEGAVGRGQHVSVDGELDRVRGEPDLVVHGQGKEAFLPATEQVHTERPRRQGRRRRRRRHAPLLQRECGNGGGAENTSKEPRRGRHGACFVCRKSLPNWANPWVRSAARLCVMPGRGPQIEDFFFGLSQKCGVKLVRRAGWCGWVVGMHGGWCGCWCGVLGGVVGLLVCTVAMADWPMATATICLTSCRPRRS